MPLLSIIIPAFNEEKVICNTITSFVDGNFPSFEVVVVDDGSTDKTTNKIIESFSLHKYRDVHLKCFIKCQRVLNIYKGTYKDVKLYLIQKENGGKGDSLNAGINFCHGDYFLCVDGDCVIKSNTLRNLVKIIKRYPNVIAIGGQVITTKGVINCLTEKTINIENILETYQELEYGIAFRVVRPIFDISDTVMLISGALGLFRKDVVIKLGGYATNTVGEDMELVMRIRRYNSNNCHLYQIRYTKDAQSYTQLPWNINDLKRQRIRWTVGLTDVLLKYRNILINKNYNLKEKLAYLFYVLFEKFSPHIEITSFLVWLLFIRTKYILILLTTTIIIVLILTIIGSYSSLKEAYKKSKNIFVTTLRLLLILITFITIYHIWHTIVRLIAVPYDKIKRKKKNDNSVSWKSPTRM